MTCNCDRTGDVEYTITLNQQGPQGRQGNAGQAGFSPIIDVYSNTDANYQLKIITANGEVITPNLKGQTPNLPTGIVTANGNNTFRGVNYFNSSTTFNAQATFEETVRVNTFFVLEDEGYDNVGLVNSQGNLTLLEVVDGVLTNTNKIVTDKELDELANDVVDINSALGSLNFKKYTKEEYEALVTPDANTVYYVTDTDNENFTIYLGSLELSGGGGGTVVSGDNASQKTYVENVDASVSATKVE